MSLIAGSKKLGQWLWYFCCCCCCCCCLYVYTRNFL